jgi:hypothetical protein
VVLEDLLEDMWLLEVRAVAKGQELLRFYFSAKVEPVLFEHQEILCPCLLHHFNKIFWFRWRWDGPTSNAADDADELQW